MHRYRGVDLGRPSFGTCYRISKADAFMTYAPPMINHGKVPSPLVKKVGAAPILYTILNDVSEGVWLEVLYCKGGVDLARPLLVMSGWATKVSEIGQHALLGAEGVEESQGRKRLGIHQP